MRTVTFHHVRDTKYKVRFDEDGPEDQQAIGGLYVSQKVLEKDGLRTGPNTPKTYSVQLPTV